MHHHVNLILQNIVLGYMLQSNKCVFDTCAHTTESGRQFCPIYLYNMHWLYTVIIFSYIKIIIYEVALPQTLRAHV